MKTESQYLLELIKNITPLDELLEGIIYSPPKGIKNNLSVINDYDSWLLKVNSLMKNINYSLDLAVKYSDSISKYNPFVKDEKKEFAYYHIENAIFRVAALWDVFAQMCNLLFNLRRNIRDINYKKFFNPRQTIIENAEYSSLQEEVHKYLVQKDKCKGDFNIWEGNHNYISGIRNTFTHRNDPHVFSILNNNGGENVLPDPPIYELKRLIEDYYSCYQFIQESYKLVELNYMVDLYGG